MSESSPRVLPERPPRLRGPVEGSLSPMPTAAIAIDGLIKSYGDAPALRGVSLEVGRGEVFGYIGPNGAGKTTTIKVLTGLLRPDAGRVTVSGFDVVEQPLEVKARVGYVPESGALYEKFTAREYLTLVGRLYGLDEPSIQDSVGRWLASFALGDKGNVPMHGLSKGMKQKVCWISALLHDPDLLILDEPLSGLDVESVARVKDLMARFAAEGRTVFYSSHLMDVVSRVCTRVAVLHQGVILAQGGIEEVARALGAPSLEQALLGLSQS